VRGGIRLLFDNWYRTGYCSSAFVAYRRGTYPDYYVLSAGHCAGGYEGSGQGRVLWGGRRLNHVTSNSFEDGSYSDSAIVPIRSAVRSRWVYVQPDWRLADPLQHPRDVRAEGARDLHGRDLQSRDAQGAELRHNSRPQL
jgi:hypothetical protein